MSLKNVGKRRLLANSYDVVHFARSIVLGYHSIPKINLGSFRGRFVDHFTVGDHFGVGTISGGVLYFRNSIHTFMYEVQKKKCCICGIVLVPFWP